MRASLNATVRLLPSDLKVMDLNLETVFPLHLWG